MRQVDHFQDFFSFKRMRGPITGGVGGYVPLAVDGRGGSYQLSRVEIPEDARAAFGGDGPVWGVIGLGWTDGAGNRADLEDVAPALPSADFERLLETLEPEHHDEARQLYARARTKAGA